jgi:hypothetical protein
VVDGELRAAQDVRQLSERAEQAVDCRINSLPPTHRESGGGPLRILPHSFEFIIADRSHFFNTALRFPLFTPHSFRMPLGPLLPNIDNWRALLTTHPNCPFVSAILGIIRFGARIGYTGTRSSPPTIYRNLSTASDAPLLLQSDLEKQLSANRLQIYNSEADLPLGYVASPLGLVDKSDGSKRRIHHLSFADPNLSSGSSLSVNDNIPEEFAKLQYSTIEDVMTILSSPGYGPGSILVKRDLEDAFRHVPVSVLDWPLLGFQWEGTFYAEQFLPFGLRTSPYIFNLFAEGFHWIVQQRLLSLRARVIHYLDDFLLIAPPGTDWRALDAIFMESASALGLRIKTAKNQQGTVAEFGGFTIDTVQFNVTLPSTKLLKAREMLRPFLSPSKATRKNNLTRQELESLTGYLSFISYVVPLGRTFIRRLYNMLLYFPPHHRHSTRRISSEALKDIQWWSQILESPPSRSIPLPNAPPPPTIRAFSDASGLKGLGGYFLTADQTTDDLSPEQAFALSLPRAMQQQLAGTQPEHINTKEMRAVEQCLYHWGHMWAGHAVVLHVDNTVVLHAINSQTTRGQPMAALRRCLLVAARAQISELRAVWISSEDNALADALSRWDRTRIADLCPQLLPLLASRPTALSHPRAGTMTFDL